MDSPQTCRDNGNQGNGWLSSIWYILATVVKSAEEGSDELFVSFLDDNYSWAAFSAGLDCLLLITSLSGGNDGGMAPQSRWKV